MVTSSQDRSKRIWFAFQTFWALIGLAVSAYLLVQHTRLKNGIQDSASFCSFGRFANCDVVNASPFSEVAGVPLAAVGAVFYFLLLALALLAGPGTEGFRKVQRWMAWLAVGGLLIDLPLLFVQAAVLHTYCIMCCLTYVATIGHLWCNLRMAEPMGGSRWKGAFFRGEGQNEKLSCAGVRLAVLSLISFSLLVWFMPDTIRIHSQSYAMINNVVDQFYANWTKRPQKLIEPQDGDGTIGDPSAKVRIVEFSDFECPFCQRTAFTLHTALPSLSRKAFFVFKYFPLDSSCNPALMYQMHPQACALARLGYCAQKKGKFWDYHDLVFLKLTEDELRKGVDQIADKFAPVFSPDEITQCLSDKQSLDAVKADIDLGNRLGVRGTPSVFIDGKLVATPPGPTVDSLTRLVDME